MKTSSWSLNPIINTHSKTPPGFYHPTRSGFFFEEVAWETASAGSPIGPGVVVLQTTHTSFIKIQNVQIRVDFVLRILFSFIKMSVKKLEIMLLPDPSSLVSKHNFHFEVTTFLLTVVECEFGQVITLKATRYLIRLFEFKKAHCEEEKLHMPQ